MYLPLKNLSHSSGIAWHKGILRGIHQHPLILKSKSLLSFDIEIGSLKLVISHMTYLDPSDASDISLKKRQLYPVF
jgi:hypothetical protein